MGSLLYTAAYLSFRMFVIFVLHIFSDHVTSIITIGVIFGPGGCHANHTLYAFTWAGCVLISAFAKGYLLLQLFVAVFLAHFFVDKSTSESSSMVCPTHRANAHFFSAGFLSSLANDHLPAHLSVQFVELFL